MSKKIIILKPRLDIPFKKIENIPKKLGKISNLRQFYNGFIYKIQKKYSSENNDIKIIEKPQWQFNKDFVKSLDFDEIYIPHHCFKTFDQNMELKNVRYYMQMVFPWLFQVDPKGWCADASVWPIKPAKETNNKIFNFYCKLAMSGDSKFIQPKRQNYIINKKYILFLCQIPHDQTIKLHSKISVEDALLRTIQISKDLKLQLVVKPHPVNIQSMEPLLSIVANAIENGENIILAKDINIHDLISNSEAIFSVNSGGGMEALLHNKPVFCFGRADYASVSHFIEDKLQWEDRNRYIKDYPKFFEAYHNMMVNVGNLNL